ncbi:type II toxin-antitoxin system RelE/ParE family toxin [Testudinibacter sp. P80/BLE/0925]|uniref:type II toxin-antitoxin system RelE/ParE family toxin n=1 Tax=Testudinibacter sp. TW-1 TaxID=3417757 RepID=UPI003D35E1B8
MQPKIIYTISAQNDLNNIVYDLTERANMRTAIELVQKIYNSIENLTPFPQMGKPPPDGTSEIYPEKYRVVYRYEANEVVVLAVIHSAVSQRPC